MTAEPSLLVLSAPDRAGLADEARRLGGLLAEQPQAPLDRMASRLADRPAHQFRLAVIASTAGPAADALLGDDSAVSGGTLVRGEAPIDPPTVVFLFPGVGDHFPGMAGELYRDRPAFRTAFDECADRVAAEIGTDLRRYIEPAVDGRNAESATAPGRLRLAELIRPPAALAELDHADIAQPLVFAVEYAMVRLLNSLGVHPAAVAGYSVGEYAAAAVAGVFAGPAAAALVAARAALITGTPPGAMSVVLLGAAELIPLLDRIGEPALVVAAQDGPHLSVVSGPLRALVRLEEELADSGVAVRRLPVDRAFHSPAMRPVATGVAERIRLASPAAPVLPMTSNVTGGWLDAADATDAAYWAEQLCRPVRFGDNLDHLWQLPNAMLLEVGPGGALSALANQHAGRPRHGVAVPTLAGRYRAGRDHAVLLSGLATAWVRGLPIDLAALLG